MTLFKFTLVKSLSYTVIIAAFGTLGRITSHLLIDRIGRKPLLIYTFTCAGIVSLIFGAVSSTVEVPTGPVKEVIWTGDEVDLTRLPIPFLHSKDGGPLRVES